MTVTYKCMVCGYTAAEPGEHCGQAMVRQEVPDAPAPAPVPAAAEAPATESTTENVPATEEKPPAAIPPQ